MGFHICPSLRQENSLCPCLSLSLFLLTNLILPGFPYILMFEHLVPVGVAVWWLYEILRGGALLEVHHQEQAFIVIVLLHFSVFVLRCGWTVISMLSHCHDDFIVLFLCLPQDYGLYFKSQSVFLSSWNCFVVASEM